MNVVYTWVDDTWPGYADTLADHATRSLDKNPNRTRDNLDILRFSLRSLERFANVERVAVISARPQLPAWLDPTKVAIVHHDEIIEAKHLPTFSSFGITTHLHRVPNVGERFLYLEDDRLFLAPVSEADFVDERGNVRLYAHGEMTPPGDRHALSSPWDRALAESNRLLDGRFDRRPRPTLKRAPLWIDRESFAAFVKTFPDAIETTRSNRFRLPGSIAPEHLYPYWLWHTRRAFHVPRAFARAQTGYVGLGNVSFLNALSLASISRKEPKFVTLNDNYGDAPRKRAVATVRQWLTQLFPHPSRFERV